MATDREIQGDPTGELVREFARVERRLVALRDLIRGRSLLRVGARVGVLAGADLALEALVASRLRQLRRESRRLRAADRALAAELRRAWTLGAAGANTVMARNGLLTVPQFTAVETQAAAALVTRTSSALGAVRTALVQGLVLSDPRQVVTAVREGLTLEGLVTFQGGRVAVMTPRGQFWDPAAYSRMVSRTAIADARRESAGGRYLANGMDVVRVVPNGTVHEICAVWEGQQLSLTGATPGLPTVDDARAALLFHPNCTHRFVVDTEAAQPGVRGTAQLAARELQPPRVSILATSPRDPRTPPPTLRARPRVPAPSRAPATSRAPAPSL